MKSVLTALLLTFGFVSNAIAQSDITDRLAAIWPKTDFTQTTVSFDEFLDGGPGKDGIPAITNPVMIPINQQDRLGEDEPVMTVEFEGYPARAYPIRYLMWHEIVNDSLGDTHFAVTFCPLCNSGVVFDRKFEGQVIELGVSGMLRNSDMVMFDRETESWWQQFNGEGLVGVHAGKKLTKIPSWMESWSDFRTRNPDGVVQDEPQSYRQYGVNPYIQYDSGSFSLYEGENPPNGINPVSRVVVIGDSAWPLERLRNLGHLTESGYTFTWRAGLNSALDTRTISTGKDVGAIRVVDKDGNNVVHDVAFAFAFHAFHPDVNWMLGAE